MTCLEQIERDLGHQLMTLAAAGMLEAGDGGRLIAEARARARNARPQGAADAAAGDDPAAVCRGLPGRRQRGPGVEMSGERSERRGVAWTGLWGKERGVRLVS